MAEAEPIQSSNTPPAPESAPAPAPESGRSRDASGRFAQAQAAAEPSLLDWRSTMPEDIRGDATLAQYKSVADVAKALIHNKSLVGRSIQLPEKPPAEDAEGWNKVFDRLGRPADPNQYALQYPELPEGIQWDPDHQRQFVETAHAMGLTPSQAQGMVALWHRINVANANRTMAEDAEGEARAKKALQETYGPSAPRLQQEAALLFDMLGRGAFAGDAAQKFYADAIALGLDNNPHFVAVMSSIYKQIGEGEFYDNAMAPAGIQTEAGIRDRAMTLTAKELKGGLTDAEKAEKDRLYTRMATRNERSGRGILNGAPML